MSVAVRFRRLLAALCGVLSVAALLLGVVYGYTARTFFRADTFATRVTDGLAQTSFPASWPTR